MRPNESARIFWEDNIKIDIKRTGYGQVNVISSSVRCLAYLDYMKDYSF
jgi:hypothetical protein